MTEVLLPSHPFAQAARSALEREAALKVFLAYPNVPLATHPLERQIRAIALDRRNWLCWWTEVGARQVGISQSLLASCRLHGVAPYLYLVEVLQRVDTHPPLRCTSSPLACGSRTSRRIPCARISIASVNNSTA